MGSFATIELGALADAEARIAMSAAFAIIDSIEAQMHPVRDGSDLARLNDAPRTGAVKVGRSTFEVLTLAKQIAAASHGLFDPCLPAGGGDFDDVELVSDCVVLCRRPVMLDLGGIAKGYAVDQALHCLREHGCENALVNIGGDIGAFGTAAQPIGLRLRGQIVGYELCNGAVAISDAGNKDSPGEHRGYYSRIDQRPLRRTLAAVLAPGAAVADALTKCAMYCDEKEWLELALKFDAALLD